MQITMSPGSIDDYRMFLRVKKLPRYKVVGRTVFFPDHMASLIGLGDRGESGIEYAPPSWMFDYQRDIVSMALRKRKFCVFADCGLGKTGILLEFAMEAHRRTGRKVLIVSPLMVVGQTIAESTRFFGSAPDFVAASGLEAWMRSGDGIAITNYEAISDGLPDSDLGGLVLDESSMLKSHYGAWGTRLLRMGSGVEYKLCATGTPAPNDRIEYGNHAVLMDAFPTVNAFLARFFVNRGQTGERWELKPHAIGPFYRSLSDWCIFLANPATYGWKDNSTTIPPMHVHVHDVPLTDDQRNAVMDLTGDLFVTQPGGIGMRSRLARIGKGFDGDRKIESGKIDFMKELVGSWRGESTIVWCKYNAEQDAVADAFDGCANISGSTPMDERERLVADFQSGRRKVLVSKPKILGFGLNLQIATRHVFSTLHDSYEEYYQAVKRSNRVGSTRPLNIHIPVTEIERPMLDNVLRKARNVEKDTIEQERIFSNASEWR